MPIMQLCGGMTIRLVGREVKTTWLISIKDICLVGALLNCSCSLFLGCACSGAQYQLQRLALDHPNQRTLMESYAAPKLDDLPLPLDWRDGNLELTEATEEEAKPDQELMAPENRLFLPSVGGNVSRGQDASLIQG